MSILYPNDLPDYFFHDSNEFIGVYLAEDLIPSRQHLDDDEFLNVEEHELDELLAMVFDGRITDSKTAAALMAYKLKRG